MVAIAAVFCGPIASQDTRAETVSAIEFYHAEFNHFFITTSPDEIAKLDGGVIKGWVRTLYEYKVDDSPAAGLVPVCRFFSDGFAPKSSHFYTAFPAECASVKADPKWTFEGEAFYVHLPDSTGACPTGTMPIYRGYNNGHAGAPAHRFTPYIGDRCSYFYAPVSGGSCTVEGVGRDGVAFCAPVSLELAQQRTQQMSGGTWEFSYSIGGTPKVVQLSFGNAVAQYPADLPPRYVPDLPYVAFAGGGVAGWDPIAGKMMVAILGAGLSFDFDGVNATSGCAFEITELFSDLNGPCHRLTVRKL